MSYLSVKVRDYVSQPGITALGLEKLANVPVATINNILRDSHPRPERLGKLLRVLPPIIARDWLVAYLRDDIPAEWDDRVEISVQIDEEFSDGRLQEHESQYGPLNTANAVERLGKAMEKDPELCRWFVRTVDLVLGRPKSKD